VIARQIVDLFAAMPCEHAELPDNLLAFIVFGQTLCARHVAKIECDIPIEAGRPFGLSDCGGQAFPSTCQIAANMSIGKHP